MQLHVFAIPNTCFISLLLLFFGWLDPISYQKLWCKLNFAFSFWKPCVSCFYLVTINVCSMQLIRRHKIIFHCANKAVNQQYCSSSNNNNTNAPFFSRNFLDILQIDCDPINMQFHYRMQLITGAILSQKKPKSQEKVYKIKSIFENKQQTTHMMGFTCTIALAHTHAIFLIIMSVFTSIIHRDCAAQINCSTATVCAPRHNNHINNTTLKTVERNKKMRAKWEYTTSARRIWQWKHMRIFFFYNQQLIKHSIVNITWLHPICIQLACWTATEYFMFHIS